MRLTELRVHNLRNIEDLQLSLAPGLNLFTGPNGAGKTSILEAAHLLSHGSSFRTHRLEHLVRRQTTPLSIFGQIETQTGGRRLGLMRREGRWTAKIDGQSPSSLTALFSTCAVVCFEPGSHALISGPAELRRSFLDWGVFHVEPDFADRMQRYRRALRQRNALLKQGTEENDLSAWENELARMAEPLTIGREDYVKRFSEELMPLLEIYLPELGSASLRFRPGWDRSHSLLAALAEAHSRDRVLGHTSRGPHRADWNLCFAEAPAHEQLSRGQEKLCAIACVLAQARLYKRTSGEWPIVALDDFCSELDSMHQDAVMKTLAAGDAQILLTGTDIPTSLVRQFVSQHRFHVEQGRVQALL